MSISSRGFDPRSALSLLFGVPFVSPPVCLAPCGFTTEFLSDMIYYTVRGIRVYLACIYAYRVLLPLPQLLLCVLLYSCCCSCCCSSSCAGWQNFAAGSLNLIPVFYFFSFKHDTFLTYPLAILSHLRPRFARATSSVIAGMRRATAGVSAAAKPPLHIFGIPFIISALLVLSLLVVTQIRRHTVGPSPPSPLRRYVPWTLSREGISAFSPRRLASNCAYPRYNWCPRQLVSF